MARSAYQYETSPRKLEPEYVPVRKKRVQTKSKTKSIKKEEINRNQKTLTMAEKIKNVKKIAVVMLIFAVLLAISYRNSVINEEFKEVKKLKTNLATIKKENGQINKSIEESLNKENLEKIATEELGMQKQTKEQTVEITIEKSDYIETPVQDTEETTEENWFEKILNEFF